MVEPISTTGVGGTAEEGRGQITCSNDGTGTTGLSSAMGGVQAWGIQEKIKNKIWQILTGRRRKNFDTVTETGPSVSSGFLDPSRQHRLKSTFSLK